MSRAFYAVMEVCAGVTKAYSKVSDLTVKASQGLVFVGRVDVLS